MASSVQIAVTVAIAIALLYLSQRVCKRSRHRLYPPGPPSLPILGNIHQIPVEHQQVKFQEWGRTYGDITYVRMFSTPAIVINSLQVAYDLMEKRGANYSDRPPLTLLNDMMGWDTAVTHFHYNDPRFRKHRKWISDSMQNREVLRGYQHIQYREACNLLLGLIDAPEDFETHIKRFAAAILTEIAYGHRVTGLDDELLAIVDKATTETVQAGSPGSNSVGLLVEFFPILKHYPLWLPGSGFRVKANEIRGLVHNMLNIPYNMVKAKIASGIAVPCFTASLVEECLTKNTLTEAEESNIKGAAGVLYAAGTDTSIATMNAFILAMARNSEVFKKAQKEMDRVVGLERLPDYNDRDSLSYLDCVLKEVLRWAAPVPLAIPHRSLNDDIYRGYEIPAGTMIIPNVWGMLRDPQKYPDPDRFWPERYEGLDKSQMDALDPRTLAFGFGRRRCPGQQLAEATTYLMAAYVIATMNISRARDEHGIEIMPPPNFHSGFVLHPEPFKCVIRVRSEKAATMVKQTSTFA